MLHDSYSAVAPYRRDLAMAEEWIDSFGDHSRATLKVQDGCDMRCTFCTIWKARGPARSRAPRDVVRQARHLAARGYREIVLAGVHLGHYGRDLAPQVSLVELVEMLLELVDDGVRLRLSSLDPGEVGTDLLDLMRAEPRLCNYLHLALQSGSDAVLERMRRGYAVADFRALLDAIAARDLRVGMGVDVITGFPGETEGDFEATLRVLADSPAAFYHVFRYSERPGSAAVRLDEKVEGRIAARRSARLREQGERARREFLRAHLGEVAEGIAVGERTDEGLFEWMLEDYATVWAASAEDPGRAPRQIRIESRSPEGHLRGTAVESRRSVA
jgi:threonylcarbamoyladenosine tRNA methylthiotransferase MtaB